MIFFRKPVIQQLTYLFGLLAVMTFASVIIYQNSGLKLHFFHESAYPLLYSESNLQTGSLYSSSFMGREISPISWPFFGSLVLLLFDGKVSIAAHVVYAMSFATSFLIVAVWYVRSLKFHMLSSLIFIGLIFTTFTFAPTRYGLLDQVWLWPMNSYGVQDLFVLICTVLIHKYISNKENFSSKNHATKTSLLFALIAFAILGFNGLRGLLMVGGGLIIGMIVDYVVQNRGRLVVARDKLVLPAVLALASSLGIFVTKLSFSGVPQPFQTSHTISTLTGSEDLGHRLSAFFWGWLQLFGAVPIPGKSVFSIENVFLISKMTLAAALFVLIIVKIFNVYKEKSDIERILTYRLGFILLVTFSAAMLSDTAGTERYLIPLQFGVIFIVPFWLDKIIQREQKPLIVSVSFILIPLMAFSIVNLSRFGVDDYKKTELYELSQHLKENNLHYGFFTPWQSDALILNQFSDGEVRVQPVDIDSRGLIQHIHSNSILFEDGSNKEFFVLIPRNELELQKQLEPIVNNAFDSEEWGSWQILRFRADQLKSVIRPALK